jgi:hypothetical protein
MSEIKIIVGDELAQALKDELDVPDSPLIRKFAEQAIDRLVGPSSVLNESRLDLTVYDGKLITKQALATLEAEKAEAVERPPVAPTAPPQAPTVPPEEPPAPEPTAPVEEPPAPEPTATEPAATVEEPPAPPVENR